MSKKINAEQLASLARLDIPSEKLSVIQNELEEFAEFASVLRQYNGDISQDGNVPSLSDCHARADVHTAPENNSFVQGYIKVPLTVEVSE